MSLHNHNLKFKIKNLKFSSAFTLIEMLIVVAIIGILVAIASAKYTLAQQNSRDNKRMQDLQTIRQALESYYNANGKYPSGPTSGLDFCAPGPPRCPDLVNIWYMAYSDETVGPTPFWTAFTNILVPTYIKQLPNDPLVSSSTNCCWQASWHVYGYTSNGQTYSLCANMENNKNTNNPSQFCPNDKVTGNQTWADYTITNP